MINAAPESHDIRFTHKGVNYCIGYQKQDDTLACSKQTDSGWKWLVTQGNVTEFLDADPNNKLMFKTPAELMDKFLAKVNTKVFTEEDIPLPDDLSKNVHILLDIVLNGLNITSTGISRK